MHFCIDIRRSTVQVHSRNSKLAKHETANASSARVPTDFSNTSWFPDLLGNCDHGFSFCHDCRLNRETQALTKPHVGVLNKQWKTQNRTNNQYCTIQQECDKLIIYCKLQIIVTNQCRHDNQSLSFPQLASDHHNFQGSTRIGVDRLLQLPRLRIHSLEAGCKSSILQFFSCLVQLCHQVSFTFQLSLLPAKTQSERSLDLAWRDMTWVLCFLVGMTLLKRHTGQSGEVSAQWLNPIHFWTVLGCDCPSYSFG